MSTAQITGFALLAIVAVLVLFTVVIINRRRRRKRHHSHKIYVPSREESV